MTQRSPAPWSSAWATTCPTASSRTPSSRPRSTPPTNGSSRARGSSGGISPPRARRPRTSRPRRARRAGRCRARGRRHRRDHRRHLDPRPDLSGGRHDGAGESRHDPGFAFDVQAVCAGFVYALANANALIVAGQASGVMVIGAETFSRILDWTDRGTCVLFGDGAGAVILEAPARHRHHPADRGVLSADLQFRRPLQGHPLCRWRRLDDRTTGHLRMQGKEVFRHAVEKLAETARTALDKAGLDRAPTSTGSCRTRPTCASSRNRAEMQACRWSASSSPCRITATPRRRRSRWRCRSVWRAADQAGRSDRHRGDRRRACLGRGGAALVGRGGQVPLAMVVPRLQVVDIDLK
jgi:hypothetical protein